MYRFDNTTSMNRYYDICTPSAHPKTDRIMSFLQIGELNKRLKSGNLKEEYEIEFKKGAAVRKE